MFRWRYLHAALLLLTVVNSRGQLETAYGKLGTKRDYAEYKRRSQQAMFACAASISESPTALFTLHTEGYFTLEERVTLPALTMHSVVNESVFRLNGWDQTRDVAFSPRPDGWHHEVRALVEPILRANGLLCTSRDGSEKTVSDEMAALRSRPEQGRQPFHADATCPGGFWQVYDLLEVDTPLSVLLALEEQTRLHVLPLDGSAPSTVALRAGELLVYRTDVEHAGANYADENVRIHIFVESPMHTRTEYSIARCRDPSDQPLDDEIRPPM